MKLLCITDIHGDVAALNAILAYADRPDVLLLGGDLTNFGSPRDAEQAIRLAAEKCDTVFAVAGNCDSVEIDKRLSELEVSLFRRGLVHDGVFFYGLSAMPPWRGTMYELTEDEIATALAEGRSQIPGASTTVILSHPPPRDTTVDLARGRHVGSTALRAHMEQHAPALVVCGHIHEARGTASLGPTQIVNCGPAFAGSFAVVDLSDGVVDVELRRAK